MIQTEPEIVLVNLGVFQAHIKKAIQNLQIFGNHNITVITEPRFFSKFERFKNTRIINTQELDLNEFEAKNKQDTTFRNGFWKNTSKRLFCLHHYMKKYSRENCIHIENDVMVFKNLKTIVPDEKKLWMVMHNQDTAIPSIMFVPDHSFLNNLVNNYLYDQNDMTNMGLYFKINRNLCRTFPIIKQNTHYNKTDIFSRHFDTFGCLFDGAAMGQYLSGIEPRNSSGPRRRLLLAFLQYFGLESLRFVNIDTRGYINESCVVDYSMYSFGWKNVDERYLPHIMIENKWIPIANLHIHTKWLNHFMGSNPTENKLIPKLN